MQAALYVLSSCIEALEKVLAVMPAGFTLMVTGAPGGTLSTKGQEG